MDPQQKPPNQDELQNSDNQPTSAPQQPPSPRADPQLTTQFSQQSPATQQVPAPIEPKGRSNTKLIVIIVIAILAFLMIGAGAWFVIGSNNTEDQTQQSTTDNLSLNEDLPTGGSTNDYDNVSFGLPYGTPGWTNDIFDNQGVSRFVNDNNSCQVSFVQNAGASVAKSQGLSPEDTVNAYISSTEAAGVTIISNNTTNFTSSRFGDGASTQEFVERVVEYSGSEGKTYTMVVAAQWIGDYELLVVSACETSDWQQGDVAITELLSSTEIYNY